MYDMTKERAISTLDDQLCHTDQSREAQNFDWTKTKAYRTAIGQLLWAISVRPDLALL